MILAGLWNYGPVDGGIEDIIVQWSSLDLNKERKPVYRTK